MASSTLKGDSQRRPHSEENQIHGDVEPTVPWEQTKGRSCRELGTWGHKAVEWLS